MPAPFPSGLAAEAARRQAGALLLSFYALVYGGGILFGALPRRAGSPLLSAVVLGTLMLLGAAFLLRRDASWRESLGLGSRPIGSVLGWSLLGFVATYAVNLLLSTAYLVARGDIEGVVARRAGWLGGLGGLPLQAILPLALFVAIWEETVFRGFLLGRLRAAMPVPETPGAARGRDILAVLLTALCFGAGHGYQGALGLLQTTSAGVVLGALTVRQQSLWPAIGAHLAIDVFGLLALKALLRMGAGS
jgi:membrane protease YdiL (CAAX protease family)